MAIDGGYLPPIVISVTADDRDLLATLAADEAAIADFGKQTTNTQVGVDDAKLIADLTSASAFLDSWAKKPTVKNAFVEVNQGALAGSLAASDALLQTFAAQQYKIAVNPEVYDERPLAQMESLSAMLAAMGAVEIDPQISQAHINSILAELDAITHSRDLAIDLELKNVAAVEAQLAALDAMGDSIDKRLLFALPALSPALAGLASGGGNKDGGLLGGVLASTLTSSLWGDSSGSFINRLLSPLSTLSALFSARFMSLGALAGFGPEHLALTGVGLAGSLAGGGIGAGLLGLGALGTEGVGLGTDLAGIGQASGDIKNVLSAQNNLTAAIQDYGAKSTEAAVAARELNGALSGFNPIARQAVVGAADAIQTFKSLFDQYTGLAEKYGAEIITQAVHVADKFLPIIGKYAAENTKIIQTDLQPLFAWISGPGLAIFTELENKFQQDLPTAMQAFDQGVELLIRMIGLIAPQTGGFIASLDRLFTRLNGSGWSKFAGEIERMISLWRTWDAFLKILIKDVADIFGKTAGLGEGIVVLLTGYLNRLHTVLTTAGDSTGLSTVFKLHKQEVLELIQVLIQFGSIMTQIYIGAAPLLIKLATDALKVINALMRFARGIPGGADALGIGLLLLRFSALRGVITTIGFGALTDALKIVAQGMITLATTAIPALDGALGSMDIAADANPIGLITLAILAFAAAIYELVKHWNTVWSFIKSHSLVSALGLAAIPIVGPFLAAAELIATHWNTVWGFMKSVGAWFSGPFVKFFTSIPKHVEEGFGDLLSFFKALPGEIVSFFESLPGDIEAVFKTLPDLALKAIGSLGYLLGQAVGEAIILMVREAELELKVLYFLFVKMPGIIEGLVVSAVGWLVPTGEHLIAGMINGILGFAPKLWTWFLNLPGKLRSFFSDAVHWLVGSGGSSLSGFLVGIAKFYLQVQKWFLGLPGKLISFFGKAGTWLIDAGVALITGFIHGLESKIPHLTGIINGIINTIKKLPLIGGLIGSPSPYFIKVGEAMMEGLEVGQRNNQSRPISALLDTSNRLKTVPFALGGRSGYGGGGMNLVVNAEFNIYAPGGNAGSIKTAIEQGSAEQFARQALASLSAGAGTRT